MTRSPIERRRWAAQRGRRDPGPWDSCRRRFGKPIPCCVQVGPRCAERGHQKRELCAQLRAFPGVLRRVARSSGEPWRPVTVYLAIGYAHLRRGVFRKTLAFWIICVRALIARSGLRCGLHGGPPVREHGARSLVGTSAGGLHTQGGVLNVPREDSRRLSP